LLSVYRLTRIIFTNNLQEVKQVISDYDPNMLVDNALTLEGFLYLHQMFIQRGRHETVWTVLKRFGHDLNLQLRQDYLLPKFAFILVLKYFDLKNKNPAR